MGYGALFGGTHVLCGSMAVQRVELLQSVLEQGKLMVKHLKKIRGVGLGLSKLPRKRMTSTEL